MLWKRISGRGPCADQLVLECDQHRTRSSVPGRPSLIRPVRKQERTLEEVRPSATTSAVRVPSTPESKTLCRDEVRFHTSGD